ncbi:hypothetical protein Acr_08g0013970 [Actinidia rufa]|uniref:Peptidase C1A papain C-terminal domain-containing protein n=1 Tax=Actinidia rufa TaxID=165716 RepID=A0A7J0F2T2_9ERIC|nr:hypothetical protein Acr_08g0013970 [Actinidia rufa]
MEADYPFVARREDCKPHKKTKLFIKDYDEFTEERHPGEILNLLHIHPIGGSIPVYRNIKHLGNKIYEGSHGQQENKLGNHAILITGYGTENGVDFYWFQNSWSTSWGVEGYGKVSKYRTVQQTAIKCTITWFLKMKPTFWEVLYPLKILCPPVTLIRWSIHAKEHEKVIVSENEMQSSSIFLEQGTDVKGNEESSVDEILSDVAVAPCKTANETPEVACELQEKDPKTSDSLSVNQIVEPKEETFGSTMSLHDLSPEVKSCDHVEVAAQIELYSASAEDGDIGSHSDAVDACDKEGEGNENVHVLLVANDLPAVDNPEITIQDFKDRKTWKSNLSVTLKSGEVIEPAVDDNNDTIYENKRVLAAEVPVEKEVDTSELKVGSKDIGSYGVEDTPETTMIQKIQIDIEGQRSHDYHTNQLQDIQPEPTPMGLSDVISVNISADDKVRHETNLCGGKNEYNIDKDKNEKCDTDGKQSKELVKEELSTNIETASVSVDDLSVSEADQTVDDLGTGNSDGAVQDKPEMNSKMTIESASTPSDAKIVVGEMDKCTNNLQEAENTTYFVHDSSEVGPDASHLRITAPARSDLQNRQGEDSEEAMKEPKSNCMNIVLAENVDAVCKGVESNHDSGAEVSKRIAETPPGLFPVESDSTMKRLSTVADDSHCRDGVWVLRAQSKKLAKPPIEVPTVDVSVDSSSQPDSLEGNWGSVSGAVLSTQSDAVAAVDAEALPSTVPEAPAELDKVNLQKPQATSGGHHSSKSDVFEPPSFMTLVEHQDG